jgi:transcriptional regulator with XRE-family HTH domain
MDGRARVAWNLRRVRVARRLSQENLAVDASVDRGYISGIENQTFNPTVDVLDRLAAAMTIDLAEFFRVPNEGSAAPETLRRGRRPQPRTATLRKRP